jgi:hypothetical protein
VTRRPAANRPPKLSDGPFTGVRDDRSVTVAPRREPPTLRQRLLDARVAGRTRLGRAELLARAREVLRGERGALLELPAFEDLDLDEVVEAIARHWGPDLGSPHLGAVTSIDPDRTEEGMRAARARVIDVARRAGRVAFATTRPASLLPLYQVLARSAAEQGADVLADDETGAVSIDGRHGRRLRWLDGVAVVTDGDALPAGPGLGAAAELLFHLPPPDLVVADRALAGGALAAQVETVCFAGFDAVALAVATLRGAPATIVPLDDRRPPAAYTPLVEMVGAPVEQAVDPPSESRV